MKTTIVFLISWLPSMVLCQVGRASLPQPSVEEFLAESLHQAIALEKLPDASGLLASDTIHMCIFSDTSVANEFKLIQYAGHYPAHIDRWRLVSIDTAYVRRAAESVDYPYLSIIIHRGRTKVTVDLISDLSLKAGSDQLLVDRGRLTLEYEYANGVCKLIKMIRWFG